MFNREYEVKNLVELPLVCECGCEDTIHKNSYYDEIGEVEYDIHCAKCGQYLGRFAYGCWEY